MQTKLLGGIVCDVKCPYCKHEQEINHDDGYGYEENRDYEQDCFSCEKTFNFTTAISFDYDIQCQESDHVITEHCLSDEFEECENCDLFRHVKDEKAGDL